MPDPRPKRRRQMGNYVVDKGPTPKRGWGTGDNDGDYGSAAAPTVGGSAPKVRVGPTKLASRKQLKASRRLKRRMGTGGMASPQAKRSTRKLF